MEKSRLDELLVVRGLAVNHSRAQRLVMAGQVRVNGQVVFQPSMRLPADADLRVTRSPRYVSRGGEKLEAALHGFAVEVSGKVCADIGASTGGFTDCLLQHGAARVYAIDVGKGLLDWHLRQDPRVTCLEETNTRYVKRLPEAISLVTVDVSFISLKVLLPVVKDWWGDASQATEATGEVVALIKPQFEAKRDEAKRGKGVIRDEAIHRRVLLDILEFAIREGYQVRGLLRSPLLGPKGNIEFFAWLAYPERGEQEIGNLVNRLFETS